MKELAGAAARRTYRQHSRRHRRGVVRKAKKEIRKLGGAKTLMRR
jgi:hypothetical protein